MRAENHMLITVFFIFHVWKGVFQWIIPECAKFVIHMTLQISHIARALFLSKSRNSTVFTDATSIHIPLRRNKHSLSNCQCCCLQYAQHSFSNLSLTTLPMAKRGNLETKNISCIVRCTHVAMWWENHQMDKYLVIQSHSMVMVRFVEFLHNSRDL